MEEETGERRVSSLGMGKHLCMDRDLVANHFACAFNPICVAVDLGDYGCPDILELQLLVASVAASAEEIRYVAAFAPECLSLMQTGSRR